MSLLCWRSMNEEPSLHKDLRQMNKLETWRLKERQKMIEKTGRMVSWLKE